MRLFFALEMKLGQADVTVLFAFAGPTPSGPLLNVAMSTGYGRQFDFLLLQKDCNTAIVDGTSIFDNNYDNCFVFLIRLECENILNITSTIKLRTILFNFT
jgi:hypothetical protein